MIVNVISFMKKCFVVGIFFLHGANLKEAYFDILNIFEESGKSLKN